MTQLNFSNRTLAIMDNLLFLRSLNNECVDLIAIDPPFAANETFTGRPRPPITDAELEEEKELARTHGAASDEGRGTRVEDHWTWDDNVHPDWLSRIEDDYPPVFAVIRAVEACASENEAAYIAFMAVRLIECQRVLKPTGSIYLHCDSHANSYLRMLMDAVFGNDWYRNEIVWRRTSAHNDSRRFGKVTDSIMFYGAEPINVDEIRVPLSDSYVDSFYKYRDDRGLYSVSDLTASGPRRGESGQAWSGHVPGRRHWAAPKTGAYADWIEANVIPGYKSVDGIVDRLNALDDAGMIHRPEEGGVPRLKRYLEANPGQPPSNLWDDIRPASRGERTGYATQKPLELYERIIKASSRPGDVVLDIFAGCATTAVAAERLNRQWIACDMAYRSWTMLKRRFALNGFALSDMTSATSDALQGRQPELARAESFTIGPNDLPTRSDEDPEPFHNLASVKRKRGRRKSARSASWSGRIPKEEAKALLVKQFGPYCWGCGWEAPKFPGGEYDLGLLEVDHIWARKDADTSGGSDELYNLALLHPTCNRRKGNRLTLDELRRRNADDQRIYGPLVNREEAIQFAAEHIAQRGVPRAAL